VLGTGPDTTTRQTRFGLSSACLVWTMACTILLQDSAVWAKSKAAKASRPEPELKVLELKITPNPYTVSAGSMEFSALVQLPRERDGATILELPSLVPSPSKTSIRFLSLRKPLEVPAATPISTEPPKVPVVLT